MIEWQLQLTFDNFLRFFSIQTQLLYFIYECVHQHAEDKTVIVAVTLSFILSLLLVITCTGLYTMVAISIYWSVLYPTLLCLYAFCIFPLQVLRQFILPLHTHLVVIFSDVFEQYFWHFLQQFLGRFVVDFLYFSSSNIICYTYVLYPHGISLLVAI